MKTQNIVAFILAALLLTGCGQSQTPTEHNVPAHVEESAGHHVQETHEVSSQVKLDNGKKWKANAATTEGIRSMTAMASQSSGGWQKSDYHQLKTKLDAAFTQTLQKCTMTGAAHEQLHNYLMPLKEIIEQLDANDLAQCEQSRINLVQYLKEYDQYFE